MLFWRRLAGRPFVWSGSGLVIASAHDCRLENLQRISHRGSSKKIQKAEGPFILLLVKRTTLKRRSSALGSWDSLQKSDVAAS